MSKRDGIVISHCGVVFCILLVYVDCWVLTVIKVLASLKLSHNRIDLVIFDN